MAEYSPQLSTLWQVRQCSEKDAASRCGLWTSWQVVHVMLLDPKQRLLLNCWNW